ncbi:MAG: cytochrome C [Elusimicrobia bacterium]|nr:cytochrome C [Elusimicrobiota bacterium]
MKFSAAPFILLLLCAAASRAADPHAGLFAKDPYPSANQCKKCHEAIYKEWSSSNHAYAAISPVFHKFEQRINDLSQGTVGTFCVRCHIPAGTALGETREQPLWKRARVSREGVTCVACHRVKEEYGRVNGERRIEPGSIHEAVYGNSDGAELLRVLSEKDGWRVKTAPEGPGMPIHAGSVRFETLSKSQFCVSCHQVAVHPGIKLEVVWEQYRASPAAKAGVSCQDCHMGKEPGKAAGYDLQPPAVVDGRPTAERAHHDHSFFGPGYPVAHPGIFPHSGSETSIEDWLSFDWRAGWGTEEFEDKLEAGGPAPAFPPAWAERIDREEARSTVERNLSLLNAKKASRAKVMENGSHLSGPFFFFPPKAGQPLRFHYKVENLNPGHNLPSGSLGAQPEIWLNVALTDPDGTTVWESGYVDSRGDMADLHSLDVAAGKVPHDSQLFNLQTKFLTTNVKGTDREMYLPINFDVDQLPFIRPAGQPVTVLNHPPGIRMEGRSIPPLGSRKADYVVPKRLLKKPGRYRLSARLRSRAEPIYFMAFIGATQETIQGMNEWMLDIHPYAVEFDVR